MRLIHGDCLIEMNQIADKSIDLVLTDLPYGLGKCKWDTIIDLELLWVQYKRVIKDNGTILLFCQQPFSSRLISSNYDWFKYEYVWVKNKVNGFLNAKLSPLKKYENIAVFSQAKCSNGAKTLMTYNPQGLIGTEKIGKNAKREGSTTYSGMTKKQQEYKQEYTNYPNNLLYFDCETDIAHPTQKPIPLLEYLIKTHSNECDTVLDNTMGSGSTGVACKNTGRDFIGIELDKTYFDIAEKRILGVE